MDFPSAPYGIHYDNTSICYFEVYKDGSVNQVINNRRAIDSHIFEH